MAGIRLTGLKPGDILLSKSGDAYIYMGYYSGRPFRSIYYNTTEGYLYIFVGSVRYSIPEGIRNPNEVVRQIRQISCFESIDRAASYVKNPKAFAEKIGHIDLSVMADIREHPFIGLTLLGDKKPSAKTN